MHRPRVDQPSPDQPPGLVASRRLSYTALAAPEAPPPREESAASTAIAIDGPVASGKSSVGMRVASALHWPFVDTGTMYRAITWLVLQRGTNLSDEAAIGALAEQAAMRVLPPENGGAGIARSKDYATVIVEGDDATPFLRTPAVERSVSIVSAVPQVRRRMVSLQRSLVAHNPVVMVGRDIGTVVLPDARLKVYLDASAETRAARRAAELARLGRERGYAEVLTETIERDRFDSSRSDSPLMPAHDAVQIRTDALGEDEVVGTILDLARNVFAGEVR